MHQTRKNKYTGHIISITYQVSSYLKKIIQYEKYYLIILLITVFRFKNTFYLTSHKCPLRPKADVHGIAFKCRLTPFSAVQGFRINALKCVTCS